MTSARDYPTDEELETIAKWAPTNDWEPFMEYVRGVWWGASWGWDSKDGLYSISTGGWSGNEEIINAMQANFIFWSMCWVSSKRGGHFEFQVPPVTGKE